MAKALKACQRSSCQVSSGFYSVCLIGQWDFINQSVIVVALKALADEDIHIETIRAGRSTRSDLYLSILKYIRMLISECKLKDRMIRVREKIAG